MKTHRNWYQKKNGMPHSCGWIRLKNGTHKTPMKGAINRASHH
jgi:hypothetical protein